MKNLILLILSTNCFLQGVCLPAEKNSLCAVNEIASNSTKPCQFPFIYENKTFYGCTRLYAGENGYPWCSTKINPLTYDHIVGQDLYGDCLDNSCPTEEQGVKSYEKFLNISTSTYAIQIYKALMPCPFTGPKMFCARPNFLSQPKNLTAFSASSKRLCRHKNQFY